MTCTVWTSHIREDLARKCEDVCAPGDREHLLASILGLGGREGVSWRVARSRSVILHRKAYLSRVCSGPRSSHGHARAQRSSRRTEVLTHLRDCEHLVTQFTCVVIAQGLVSLRMIWRLGWVAAWAVTWAVNLGWVMLVRIFLFHE